MKNLISLSGNVNSDLIINYFLNFKLIDRILPILNFFVLLNWNWTKYKYDYLYNANVKDRVSVSSSHNVKNK